MENIGYIMIDHAMHIASYRCIVEVLGVESPLLTYSRSETEYRSKNAGEKVNE